MAFEWGEFFELAQFLAGNGDTYTPESAFRTAVSRAYYAAFCAARGYASDHQRFMPSYTGADHGDLREHFRRQSVNDKRWLKVASKLQQIGIWRTTCDYDESVDNLNAIVNAAITSAKSVFTILRQP